jgi:hypothetical protein
VPLAPEDVAYLCDLLLDPAAYRPPPEDRSRCETVIDFEYHFFSGVDSVVVEVSLHPGSLRFAAGGAQVYRNFKSWRTSRCRRRLAGPPSHLVELRRRG